MNITVKQKKDILDHLKVNLSKDRLVEILNAIKDNITLIDNFKINEENVKLLSKKLKDVCDMMTEYNCVEVWKKGVELKHYDNNQSCKACQFYKYCTQNPENKYENLNYNICMLRRLLSKYKPSIGSSDFYVKKINKILLKIKEQKNQANYFVDSLETWKK